MKEVIKLRDEMQKTKLEQEKQMTEFMDRLSSEQKELDTLEEKQTKVHTTYVMCIVLL